MNYAATTPFLCYVALVYEYEFRGNAKAMTFGFDVAAASLKGYTGIGGSCLTFKPAGHDAFSFDVGIQAYAGKHEGVAGIAQMKSQFWKNRV